MTGVDSDDPTHRAARDAAAALHGESLTGAPPPSIGPTTTTTRDHDGTASPRARPFVDVSAPIGARADAEARWLASTTRELRRLLPDEPSDDANASTNLGTSFVRLLAETRRAMPAPNPRVVEPAPPLPALPLGASIVPIADLARRGACASDLRTLWSRSRARVREPSDGDGDGDDVAPRGDAEARWLASTTREHRRPLPDHPSDDDRYGPGRSGRSGRSGPSSALRDAPVVPLALVGRLRLPPSDDTSEGFLRLEDASGWTRVACLGLPDARALGRRVIATAWLRPRGGGAVVEVASFEVLDEDPTKPRTAARPMAEPADASDPAPPPARKGGFDAVGAVVAVSPAITLRGEEGASPSRFFMAELARCPRCGRGPAEDDDDTARRIMFKGESSATWRPFLGAATGGEFCDFVARASSGSACGTACGCVRVTNLRKSALPHPRGKIRLALATSETTVSPNDAPDDPPAVADAVADAFDPPACACASCARGATLARLDAFVVGVDPTGAGVLIGGRRSSRGTPFLMTHAEISRGRARADVVASLRPGARVVITHAHPVWRVATEIDDDEEEEEEEDHWGLRAVGACSRTRARVVTPSSADAPAPTLFAETETGNWDGRDSSAGASRVVSARTLRRACEEETFAGASRFRQLAAALREKFDCERPGGRRAASRLLLGKRARDDDGGPGASGVSARSTTEDADRSDGFDLNLAIHALRGGERERGDGGDGNSRVDGDASIYHEFFLPSREGMGGDETPIPKIPTLRAVFDAAIAAFADASKRAVAAERDARRREGVVVKLPYGLKAGAVDVDRLVASGASLLGGEGALLLAWCRRRERPNGASVLRVVDDTIEIDLEIVDDDDEGANLGVGEGGERAPRAGASRFPPPDAMFAATRWFAVVEGARDLAARDGRDTRAFPERLARPSCRIRVHRRDVYFAANGARVDPATAPRTSRTREPRPTVSVSDASVWTPLDARGRFRGDRPAPLGGIPAIDPNRDDSYLRPHRHPQKQTVAEPFVAVVSREFYATDSGGFSLRLELRDVRGVESMLVYVNDKEGAIPIGVGAGAVVVVRDALRVVSGKSFAVYLKFQAQTRVEVLSPSTATLAFPGETPTGVGVPPPTEPPARVTLAEVCAGARRSVGAIDQRAWETRARIVSVASLVARWGCRRCGCDAGSIGATAAAAAAASAAATADADGCEFDAAAFLADVHGCEACRPAPGRPAATSEACGFEAEIFATMCDGGEQVEITVSGDAGAALIPPGLTSELLRLARKHGRVSAKLAKRDRSSAAGDSYASHDVLGYAGMPVGEREGAAMLAAVGHLTSLGEMIFTVKLKYSAHDAGSDEIGAGPGPPAGTAEGSFGATSAARATTRTLTVGGVPTSTLTQPFVRVRVLDAKRAEPAREAARALAEMETRRRE